MELGINIRATERRNRQFWLMVVILFLPMTAFAMDFPKMLSSLKNVAPSLIKFVGATAYVIGIWFMIAAVMELKKIGQSQSAQTTQGTVGPPLIKFVIGAVLIYLPTTIDVGVASLWGTGSVPPGYPSKSGDPFGPAKEGAIAIVRVVGYVSFVRGLIMLSHSADQGSQQGGVGKGIMHLVGGILAINVVGTINIISNTLGFSVI